MDLFKSSGFAKHAGELLNEWHVPGVAVAIIEGDATESKGYGTASFNPERPVTADSLFDIASSSKSLTAGSVGLLVADDEKYPHVQWDAKMSKLLPDDFVMSEKSYTEDVTVEDILSHRTGLPGHDSSYVGDRGNHPDTPQSVTRNLRNLPVTAPIRSRYMYCNMMLTVATHLIESLTGLSFTEFLQDSIFNPLGMTSTYLEPKSVIDAGLKDRIAMPYKWNEDETWTQLELDDCPESQGAGSIFTSVNDYIKWVKALMNQESPLTEETAQGLIKPRIIEDPEDDDRLPMTSFTSYATGLETYYYRGHRIVQHDGAIPGYGSEHFFLPDLKFGGVVLGNANGATSVTTIIAKELIDEFLNVPKDERPDWNAIFRKKEDEYEAKKPEENKERRQKLCPNDDTEPQKLPLEVYTGTYSNTGYHSMKVEVKQGQLYIDATDRTMGFTLTLEHICHQTKYIAHMSDYFEGGDGELAAEFKMDNDKTTKLGLELVDNDDGFDDLIWFDRVEGSAVVSQR